MKAPVKFLTQVWDELKLVKWPTRQDVLKLTVMVIFVSVIVGLYIGAIDYIFTKVTELIIK